MCRADAIFHVEHLTNCRAVEIQAVEIRAVDPDSLTDTYTYVSWKNIQVRILKCQQNPKSINVFNVFKECHDLTENGFRWEILKKNASHDFDLPCG